MLYEFIIALSTLNWISVLQNLSITLNSILQTSFSHSSWDHKFHFNV